MKYYFLNKFPLAAWLLLLFQLCTQPVAAQNLNTPNVSGPMGLGVNTLSGNLFFERADVVLPARSFPLAAGFAYNSFDFLRNKGFGNGWSFQYHIRYTETTDTLTIFWGDGREDHYRKNGVNAQPPNGFFTQLEQHSPGKWRLTEKDGTRFYFDNNAHKRITKMEEPNGNFLSFGYTDTLLTTITHSGGQNLTLVYNINGWLSTITDAMATPTRSWQYQYDGRGNLIRVQDPAGFAYQYSYLVNGPMKETSDRNGNVVNIIYYSNYAVSELIGCNMRLSIAYDESTLTTVVTNHMASGEDQVTKYFYTKKEDQVWLTGMKGNCCGYQMTFEYDDAGNKIKETDANGNTTTYAYDARGNVTKVTDALGQTWQYTYTNDYNNIATSTDPKGQITRMTYDSKGNLLTIADAANRIYTATYAANGDVLTSTDPGGHVYQYQYDAQGNPSQVTGPNGYKASLAFDTRGRLLSYTDSRNLQSQAEYDILNRLKKLTDPLNQEFQMQYDANGNLVQSTNPANETMHISYDATNRPVVLKDAVDQSSTLQYDEQSNLTLLRNVLNQTIQMEYDKLNRLIRVTNAIGEETGFEYDNNDNLTMLKLPNGRQLRYLYDALDRLVKMEDNNGMLAEIAYDQNDNITSFKNGTGALVTASYDALNRPVSITDPLGNIVKVEYDVNGLMSKTTDQLGNTNQYEYDGRKRIVKITDQIGATVGIAYDANNNVSSLTDQKGNVTEYQYDALNRVTRTTYADGKFMAYGYDVKSNLITARLTDGTQISYSYDTLNRMVAKTLPDGRTFTYTYDGLGRVLTATNNAGTVAFAYDNLNRIISETFKGRTVQYSYNTAGRTQSTTYPDGTVVTMQYDTRDRLTRVLENGLPVADYTYNAANRVLSRTLANGISTQYQYDVANRLIGYTSGDLQQVQISYDKMGNKTAVNKLHAPQLSERFTYDNNYRITAYQRGPIGAPNQQHSYTYDALGNRLSATINGVLTNYISNSLNQLTQTQAGATTRNLLYDDNGNLRFDGLFYKTYDAEKRLLKDSASPSAIYTYQYDAVGRRVGKVLNGQLYEYSFAGMVPLEEYSGGQQLTKQVYSGFLSPLSIQKNQQRYYYLQNELGSVENISNGNGRLIERYEYDPYGKQQRFDSLGNPLVGSLVGNRIGFTGQEYDSATASNAFYFRNYNPELGIFQQRDLIGYADGMGLYQYVGNNPANGIDVLGLEDCDPNKRVNINTPVSWINAGQIYGKGMIEKIDPGLADEVVRLRREAEYLYERADRMFEYSKNYRTKERIKKSNNLLKEALNANKKADNLQKSLMKAKQSKLNTVSKFGHGLTALDNLSKAEALASSLFDGQTDGYHTQEYQAGAELGISLLSWHPVIGTVYGLTDLGVETITGKGITSHLADAAQWGGQKSVDLFNDNATEQDMWDNAAAQGRLRQWLEAKKKMEERENRRKPNCPQNGNNGGTRKPSPYPADPQSGRVQILGSYDPNEIIGPVGQPDKRWVSVNDRLPFTVNFENDSSATAPAKTVRITVPVHPNLDPAKFELGSFGFNSLTFSIPTGTAAYYQRLDCRDSLGLFVDITAGYDVQNNQAFWLLQSIDPTTLQSPTDPLKGLLLLQDSANASYGHGFVNFSIIPNRNSATRDSITEKATIIFDTNDPIPTNIEWNTIDAAAPTTLLSDPIADASLRIQLQWSGNDDPGGSGIASYSLYVSTDGINYGLVRSGMTRTDTTLLGQPNSSYFYFVLATDRVGNTEALRSNAIRSITLSTALPVTWLYFTGRNAGTDNHLQWATAKEQQTSHFVVERSLDGIKFSRIGQVAAAGTSNSTSTYQYTDADINRLGVNLMYYRLQQVDQDGRSNLSSTITLAYHPASQKRSLVYPNPASQWVTVALGDAKLIGTKAILYDEQGRVLQTIPITQMQQRINLSNYTNGLYFIKLSSGEALKVMKQ